MVAVTPETAARAAQDPDLRWKIGAGLAVIWVAFELWNASPLPYTFGRLAGTEIHLISQTDQWVHFAFAAAAVFLLFAGRLLRPVWLNIFLAVVAAAIIAYPLWAPLLGAQPMPDLEELTIGEALFDLVMVGLSLLVMVTMAARVFGSVAAVLAVLALFPPVLIEALGEEIGSSGSSGLSALASFFAFHYFLRNEDGMLYVLVSSAFLFPIAFIGVALDRMGWGQRAADVSARLFAQFGVGPITPVPIALAGWLFTIAFVLGCLLYLSGEFSRPGLSLYQTLVLLILASGLYASSVFGAARYGRLQNEGPVDLDGFAAPLLDGALGATHFAAIVAVVTALAFGFLSHGLEIVQDLFGLPILGLGVIPAILAFSALGCLAVLAALRPKRVGRQRLFAMTLVGLPIVTFNWMMVGGLSPGHSAFYAAIVVLLCVLAWRLSEEREEAQGPASALGRYLKQDLVLICISTARTMAVCTVIAAFYPLVLLWWWGVVLWWMD